jgi:anti-sigma-K factor RskA
MRDEHIKRTLEESPLSSLGKAELEALRAHAEGCADCRSAFEAAQVSSLMMKARAAETFEPSPFFQTRVLAQLRERRGAEEGWTLARLWKTAGLLVSSMAATVAALAVFTFVAPPEATAQATVEPYTAEAVILDESDSADEQMSIGQVFTTLYESDEESER